MTIEYSFEKRPTAEQVIELCANAYLADLAVRTSHQKEGIGRKLIALTKEKLGDQSMVLLLSVPTAMDYYPKVGFKKQESSFIMDRADWRIS